MINLSERDRKQGCFKERFFGYWDPEVYLARDVKDYLDARSTLVPPLRSILTPMPYAYILFYNISIDAIVEDNRIEEKYVHVHDQSGLKVMSWTNLGDLLPAEKPYFQMLGEGELCQKDHVYRLVVRHVYECQQPFVAEVVKFRPAKLSENVDYKESELTSGITFALP